jgi:tetratricopeptide (TPR) repeat protein
MRTGFFMLLALLACSAPAKAQPRLADYVGALRDCNPLAGPTTRSCTMERRIRLTPEIQRYSDRFKAVLDAWTAGDLVGAMGLADAMIVAHPDRPNSRQLRAHLRRAMGDLPGALADLDAAIRPTHPDGDLLADRCSVRHRLGDTTGAEGDCNAAVPSTSIAPGWYGRSVRAGLLLLRGDDAAAERDIAAVLRDYPYHPLARRLRGWLHTLRGDAAGATKDVTAARAGRPGVDAELLELLGAAPPDPPAAPEPSRGTIPGQRRRSG